MAALCSLVLLVSAFLLFAIQPMVAKMLLPILGGSPSVWNTAMVFYQGALLGGYLYAHLLTKKLKPRTQLVVHIVVLALPLFVLPLYYGNLHPPSGVNPIPWMMMTMALSVGLPFFVLSASSPLVQTWFARSGNKDPYFLYAASNVGSFLGLLSYPFLIEPKLPVMMQSSLWTGGYIMLAVLFIVTALKLPTKAPNREEAEEAPAESLTWARRLRWVFLAFIPSSQFIGVTTYLTTDIAVMPLLWVIPLAIYLLTMVLVFAKKPPIPHKFVVTVFPYVLGVLLFIIAAKELYSIGPLKIFDKPFKDLPQLVFPVHLLALFMSAMLCHGELAKDRPSPARLTEFFLWMSFGGVLGGIFNALVAPLVFVQVIEYSLILAVVGLAIPARVPGWKKSLVGLDFAMPIGITLFVWLLIRWQEVGGMLSRHSYMPSLVFVGCLGCVLCAARPLRFALAIAGMLLIGVYNSQSNRRSIFAARSFFGVHRVEEQGEAKTGITHIFMNGRILHGKQIFKPGLEKTPLTYYHPDGPLGDVMGKWPRAPDAHIGVIGLGIGTTALWSRKGEDWTFYEIDEMVDKLAHDTRLFTCLSNAEVPPKIIIGDARLRLSEAPDSYYDIITVDAFSSDAIPAHLMTYEAFQLYRAKLKPNGILAVHISNRYLDLEPLVAALGDRMMWRSLIRDESFVSSKGMAEGRTAADWCVLGAPSLDWSTFTKSGRWVELKHKQGIVAWTDDYSSLMPLMRW